MHARVVVNILANTTNSTLQYFKLVAFLSKALSTYISNIFIINLIFQNVLWYISFGFSLVALIPFI